MSPERVGAAVRQPTPWGWRVALLALGAAIVALLVATAVLSGQGGAWWALTGALLGLMAVTTVLLARWSPTSPRGRLGYAVVPVTAGLASITVTVGASRFPGELLWWVPGAVLSALPLWAFGVVGGGRRGRRTRP